MGVGWLLDRGPHDAIGFVLPNLQSPTAASEFRHVEVAPLVVRDSIGSF